MRRLLGFLIDKLNRYLELSEQILEQSRFDIKFIISC
jgi:hypothetical protein